MITISITCVVIPSIICWKEAFRMADVLWLICLSLISGVGFALPLSNDSVLILPSRSAQMSPRCET